MRNHTTSIKELNNLKLMDCLNLVKTEGFKNFTLRELQIKLKSLNCPHYFHLPTILNKLNIVNTNVYDLKYNFSDSIIEFDSIEKYLNILRKKIYKKREYNKDKVLTLNQKANLDPMDFDKACKIVRSFGYKIFKEI